MSEWTIQGTRTVDGTEQVVDIAVVKELELHDEWMGECFLTVSIKNAEPIDFAVGDYIDYRGERYTIEYDPTVLKKARRGSYGEGFTYDNIKFVSEAQAKIVRCDFTDIVLYDNGQHYTSLPTFPFYCETVDDLLDRIQANLNELYDKDFIIIGMDNTRNQQRANVKGNGSKAQSEYEKWIGGGSSDYGSKGVALTVDNINCWDALAKVHSDFGLNFIVRGYTIIVGTAGMFTQHNFTYGKGNGLYEVERIGDSEQQIVTRLRAYGAETNLPLNYYANLYKKPILKGFRNKEKSEIAGRDWFYGIKTNILWDNVKGAFNQNADSAQCQVSYNGVTATAWVVTRTNGVDGGPQYLYLSFITDNDQDIAFYNALGDDSEKTMDILSGVKKEKWPSSLMESIGGYNYPAALVINRLMLPGFPDTDLHTWVASNRASLLTEGFEFSTNAERPYIDSPNTALYGIRPGSIYFDGSNDTTDIHPTITGTGYDEIVRATQVDDQGVFNEKDPDPITIVIPGMGDFKLDEAWKENESSIDITDGMCGGRSFQIVKVPKKVDGNWECQCKRAKDDTLHLWFPYCDFQINANGRSDHFVLTGIDLPDEYVRLASERLFDAAIEALRKNDAPRFTYQPRIDEIWMQRQDDLAKASQADEQVPDIPSIHDTLKAGDIFRFADADIMGVDGNDQPIVNSIIIDVLTIKENGNNGIPTYEVTLRDEKQVSTIQKIQKKIDSLACGGNGYGGGGGGSSMTAAQIDSLVPSAGENYFISKQKDDTANGIITFLKGIKIGLQKLFGWDSEGNITANNVTIEEDLHVDGFLYAPQSVRTNEVRSDNYTGDTIADTGFLLTNGVNTGGHSKLTIDEIYVRMKAVFESLEVKKWSVSAGDEIRSCAANIINKVDYYADESQEPLGYSYVRVPWLLKGIPFLLHKLTGSTALERWMFSKLTKERRTITDNELRDIRFCRCYFLAKDGTTEVQNWWMANDLARCQTMNVVNTSRDTFTNIQQKAGNVFWWRKVIRVSNQPVELEKGNMYHYFDVAFNYDAEQRQEASIYCLKGSDIPAAGDHVSQFGNTVIPGRMNLMMILINGGSGLNYEPSQDAPCIKAYKGIYTFDMSKCWFGGDPCKMKLSPNTGYVFYGPEFKFVREYGIVPAKSARGAWEDIPLEDDHYAPRSKTIEYSDDIVGENTRTRWDGSSTANVRKCYYYDEVTHKGCTWLCTIATGMDGAHWIAEQTFTQEIGNVTKTFNANRLVSDSDYNALTDENKAKCARKPDYTADEPSDLSPNWLKTVNRGTSVKTVTTKYNKKSPTELNPGTVPPNSGWVSQEHIGDLNLKNGDYFWTWTHTEYSDTLEPTDVYQASRWGIDGDGISRINSYYWGTANTSIVMNAAKDAELGLYMPGDPHWSSAGPESKWFDSFGDMATANGGVGAMQGWNVWEKTIIVYDDVVGSTTPKKPDVVNYTMSRLGIDGQMLMEEYYCLRTSDQIEKAFPNGSRDGGIDYCGIRWYRGSYAQSDGGRLAESTPSQPNIDPTIWDEQMPVYSDSTPANAAKQYLWNFEQRVDGQGTEYGSRPICLGDHSRGIVGVVELYALSSSGSAQSNHHIPDDIWAANNNSETDYSKSSTPEAATNMRIWTDEKQDRSPSEALPYQWNWSRTLYKLPKDASDIARDPNTGWPFEDHWHVSAVRGSRGEDGAGIEYIYKLTTAAKAPSTPSNPTDRTVDDYVPSGWTDNPTGISFDSQYEWVSERQSTATTGTGGFTGGHRWGDFSTPRLWSKWGKNGMDGDGVEYVFARTTTSTPPSITNDTYNNTESNYNNDEFLPHVTGAITTSATDDPQGTTRQYPYEWVAKRSKADPNPETGIRKWEKYSGTMAEWSNYADSAIRLDIDNEMDMVQTDSTGKITAARTVETIVHFYDGATEVNISSATISISGGPATSGTSKIADYSATASGLGKKLSWTFIKDKTMADAYEITISYTYTYTVSVSKTYTAVFTIAASKGQPVYQIRPNMSSASFSRTTQNTLTPTSRRLMLDIIKIDGDSTTILDNWNGFIMRYSTTSMPSNKNEGSPWQYSISGGQRDYYDIGNTVDYGELYLALFNTAGTLIDRETIPVVKDGANGKTPDVSVAVYAWNQSATSAPSISGNAYPPSGWSTTAPSRPTGGIYYLWMSQSVRHTADNGAVSYDAWGTPVRISGDEGTAGEDAKEREWVYKVSDSNPGSPTNPSDRTVDDYVPSGWNDNPSGVTSSDKTEWASWRDFNKSTKKWGDFNAPIIWSHYGERGMDGDGVEYVFMRTRIDVAPTISSTQTGYTADEYKPPITNQSDSGAESGTCTDDPKGTTDVYVYEWVAKRNKVLNSDGKTRTWEKYPTGDMSLWAKWSKDASQVNPNILRQTRFISGKMDKWDCYGEIIESALEGRNAFGGSGGGSWNNIMQQTVAHSTGNELIQPSTQYTLSWWAKSSIAYNVFIYPDAVKTPYLIDGTTQGTSGDGYTPFGSSSDYEFHYITFTTRSSFASLERILWRANGGSTYICMPKLERGDTPTAYMPHESELDGDTPEISIDPNSKNWIINGVDTHVKAEGDDGTGVEIKGSVATVSAMESDGYVTPVGGSRVKADKGDCYICNSNRHLYMWDDTIWVDLGEFQGEPGKNSYMHIAYANTITIVNGVVTAVTGFTVNNNGGKYDWMGFCTDNSETDPGSGASSTDATAANKYKWNYMKGKDGNGVEYIYLLTKEGFTPTINQTSGQGSPSADEFRPAVANYSGNQSKIYPGTGSGVVYWDDDPPSTVSETWPVLWWANRKNQDGAWQQFGAVTLHNRYSKDGKDAASLVFSPAIVVFEADSNEVVKEPQTVQSSVQLQLPDGTLLTPTLSNMSKTTSAECTISGSVISIKVYAGDSWDTTEVDGYCKVTGTATYNGITYNATDTLVISCVKDGANGVGERGKVGRFYYYAGNYSDFTSSSQFVVSDAQAPYFFYSDNYWVFNPEGNGTYTKSQMGTPSLQAANWELMTSEFKYIITEAIFGSFAKFGASIMNGDYMMSQYVIAKGFLNTIKHIDNGTKYQYIETDDVLGENTMYDQSTHPEYFPYNWGTLIESNYISVDTTSYNSSSQSKSTFRLDWAGCMYSVEIEYHSDVALDWKVSAYSYSTAIDSGSLPAAFTEEGVFYTKSFFIATSSASSTSLRLFFKLNSSGSYGATIRGIKIRRVKFVPTMVIDMLRGKMVLSDLVARGELHADSFYYTSISGNNNNDTLYVGEESIVMLGTVAAGTKVVLPSPSSCKGRKIEVHSIVQSSYSWKVSWNGASSSSYFLTMPTVAGSDSRNYLRAGDSIGASTYALFYSDGSHWWILKCESVVVESGRAKVVNNLYY